MPSGAGGKRPSAPSSCLRAKNGEEENELDLPTVRNRKPGVLGQMSRLWRMEHNGRDDRGAEQRRGLRPSTEIIDQHAETADADPASWPVADAGGDRGVQPRARRRAGA